MEISLISSVNKAIWPSIEPVFFGLPPYSAIIEIFFSLVTLDISVFFDSSLFYIQNLAAKVVIYSKSCKEIRAICYWLMYFNLVAYRIIKISPKNPAYMAYAKPKRLVVPNTNKGVTAPRIVPNK